MPIKQVFGGKRAPVKIWTDDVEPSAMDQLHDMASLPFIHKHIAVMPDVHWGMGSTVGSVIPTVRAIVPACVGVDLGCGMMAVKLDVKADELPDSLASVRLSIERSVPHGRTDNGGANDRGAWHSPPDTVRANWMGLSADLLHTGVPGKHPKMIRDVNAAMRQLGTLGTGNHFVEVCLDKEDNVWVMLHSGSRGIGNRIGSYFISEAKEQMQAWHIELADPDLAFLPEASPLFEDYWRALSWAQGYARINRELMMANVLFAIEPHIGGTAHVVGEAVNCHHNYVALEHHYGQNVYVTRKGAVRAREGDLGIIPGSMGARSFIVRGKGNPESFHSCSHGAGRRMSRGEAKRRFSVADLAEQTAGIECRKDADVIDEIPGAYKDIQTVMDNQSDLVDIVAELHQVLCVKG